jgi:Flp pilus assembly protein TadD
MRAAFAVAVFATALLIGAPARGSEESEALSARGLIALQAGRTQEALQLFDRAVAADPADPEIRYQRGTTRAKLGDNTGAIEDLRAALAARPNFPEAALELGATLNAAGQYQEAEHWLQLAQYDPPLDAQASFLLGIAQLRLGRLDAAEQNFIRARTKDPSLAATTQYYEGVVAYRRHDLETAEEHFTAVERAQPNTAAGREATVFLSRIRESRRAAYAAFGSVALEYDTNVTLGPAAASGTVPEAITGKGDWRFVINAGGRYVALEQRGLSVALGYEFFQSLQFHLTDFDLQDHRPSLQLTYDFGPVLAGVLGRYDYYLLGGDSFLSEATAFPWVALREEGIGRTEVYYRMQYRDYKNASVDEEAGTAPFKVLNGFYNFVGVRQVIDLGHTDRELWFGYRLGFNDMESGGSELYQYGAHQFEVALRWLLPYAVVAETGFQYERQDYSSASAVFPPVGDPRRDNDYRAIVAFERPLAELYEHLFVNAAWYGTFNDSNKAAFEYDRQIGSVGAEVRF